MAAASEECEPPVVDCDVLEAAKENIQPLAKGRSVTALSAILSTPHAQRERALAAARNRHRINVTVALEDEDDDPLEAYCRFVYWTVENYPQGHSAESGLLELLEEATRVLKDDRGGRWRDDLRYLKLWVLYASYVEKPAIIYKFCMVNEIGTSHSLLYEEFATVLERAGRRAEADETYLLGIARKASPVERLENRHREFQKRMMASFMLPPAAPAASEASAFATPTTRRPALAEAASSSSSSSRTRVTRSASTRARQEEAAPSPSPAPTQTPAAPRPNARIPVFIDPDGTADTDPASPSPWPELATRKSRIKENVPEVKKMAGTTLRQAGRSHRSAASSSRIPVYRDPESDSAAAMPPPAAPVSRQDSKSKSKSTFAVFRDDDAAAAPQPPATLSRQSSKSKAAFTVFSDDDAEAAPQSSTHAPKVQQKSKITVFRDEDAMPQSSAPVSRQQQKSKITVFRDDDLETTPPYSIPPSAKKHQKSSSSISVFRDEDDGECDGKPSAAASFVPYRDEEPTASSSSSSTIPATFLRPKTIGPRRDGAGLTEAE
ncbi:hypothetical protein WOLCODRAFT_107216, partial [Wolfiporia cocos MD-104 SS10]